MTSTTWLGSRGWALILNALIGVVLAIDLLFNLSHPKALTVLQLIGSLLFMVGLSAIAAMQPDGGQIQWLGIGLMELAAVIAFVLTAISLFGSNIPDGLAFVSALCGMIGGVLIGAITIRRRVFPAWAAWLLAVSGVINFVTGQLDGGTWLRIVAAIGGLLAAAAIVGYGRVIVEHGKLGSATPHPAQV